MFKQKYFVAIAGNIGTGKTTLSTMLAERFGWHAHCEAVVDNPYLADFYGDMKRWSFPLQVYFLNSRVRAHQLITYDKHSAIQDRSVYEDAHIFARNLFESGDMERRDYENYLELYQLIADQLNAPDLIIYLRKSLPKLKEQITRRGRDYEQKIPDQYLLNLNRYYEEWLTKYNMGQKLIIESDHLDYVANPEHFDWICDQIVANLPKTDQLALPTLDREPVRVL